MAFPLDIMHVGEYELLIPWDDQHRSLFTTQYLRSMCPCAQCLDEWTGKRILKIEAVDPAIRLVEKTPVGRYGVRLVWSDGHQTGIYSFEYLRRICPCDQCKIAGN